MRGIIGGRFLFILLFKNFFVVFLLNVTEVTLSYIWFCVETSKDMSTEQGREGTIYDSFFH